MNATRGTGIGQSSGYRHLILDKFCVISARATRFLAPLTALLVCAGCSTQRNVSFMTPQGPIAAAERGHFIVVILVLVIFVALPIFLFTPWVLWRYRYGTKKASYTPKWKENNKLLFFTWIGPVVIVIALGFLVWNSAHNLDPYQPVAKKANALQIQAIGYNWKWLFVYPHLGIATVGVMAVPVGKPVAMHLTSATVMQSLHIPALVSQIYAMGGMVTQLHFMAGEPGRSLGMNNMYNGEGFHQQRFTTIAMSPQDFEAWVHKVRKIGVPLNADTYKYLSRFNTVKELTEKLSEGSQDGNVYLTKVSPDLFPAVVMETMTDTRKRLRRVLHGTAKKHLHLSDKVKVTPRENWP